jgi:hypothetical protein
MKEALQESTVQTTQPQQDSNQLTINDLVAMRSIIDIASQRGAFKPNEMVVVGQTYNKISSFLEIVKQQQAQKEGVQ